MQWCYLHYFQADTRRCLGFAALDERRVAFSTTLHWCQRTGELPAWSAANRNHSNFTRPTWIEEISDPLVVRARCRR